jgi:16S rRNA (adenine1518-N6/adenine1519-N6)-dimethyltransferase
MMENCHYPENSNEEKKMLDLERQNIIEKYKSDLFQRLEAFGIHLDPDGKDQHLVVNPYVIDDLISFGEIGQGDTVLEIGGGPGNITERLAKLAGHVYTVETDIKFQSILESLKVENSNLEIIMGDFLDIELPKFNKIVANPPFSILEPMIQRFAEERFELASLILGENYYKRVMAKPGTENFTKTSLFTQAHFIPEFLKNLDKEDFCPKSRERAVIMKLISSGKSANSLLQQISDAFSKTAGKRVSFLVNNICNQYGTPKGKITEKNLEQIITSASLNIPSHILSKRLQELSNREISQLVEKLLRIRSKHR